MTPEEADRLHPLRPAFAPGTTVKLLDHPGWTGDVLAADVTNRKYLLDCHPGAVGGYVYIWLGKPDEFARLYAANWISEDRLEADSPENLSLTGDASSS
jgi:hypothetical protein